MTNKDTLQEWLRKLAQEWPERDTNIVDVKCTGIERAIPPGSTDEYAKKALEYCKLARQFGATEKGFLFLIQAESARKDFELFDDAIKFDAVRAGPDRRENAGDKQDFINIVQKLANEMPAIPNNTTEWSQQPKLAAYVREYPYRTLREWIKAAGITLKNGRSKKHTVIR